MNRLIRPLQISNPQILIEIITEAIDEIQSGATIVDTSLGNDEYGCIDLIAADKNKRSILFFINTSGQEIEFFRSFKCLCWYQENRTILQKLYSGLIDTALPPSIYFLSPTYSHSIRKVLLNLKESHITLMKYTCFQDGENMKVLLEKIAAVPGPSKDEGDNAAGDAENTIAENEADGNDKNEAAGVARDETARALIAAQVAGDAEDVEDAGDMGYTEDVAGHTEDMRYPRDTDRTNKDIREEPDGITLPPSISRQSDRWSPASQSGNRLPAWWQPDNRSQSSQPDGSQLYPPDRPPTANSGKAGFDSAKLRQDIGFDISNISDEELQDLLLGWHSPVLLSKPEEKIKLSAPEHQGGGV